MPTPCPRCGAEPDLGRARHNCEAPPREEADASTAPAPPPVWTGTARPAYEPASYWQGLHENVGGLSAVGDPYAPERLNAWFYRTWSRNLGRFVDRFGLHPESVFDVGAGTGFWVDWWLHRGAREVDGCDLAPAAVNRLNRRFGPRFILLDISKAPAPGRYALVSAMSVLLHITEPEAFRAALRNVATAVGPGGYLLLMDPLVTSAGPPSAPEPGASSLARPAAAYIEPLRGLGLNLVAVAGATALAGDPVETGRSRQIVWDRYWAWMSRATQRFPGLASPLGRIVYRLDPLLLRLGCAPSAKFVLFRRPPESG